MREGGRVSAALTLVGLTIVVAALPADTTHRNALGAGEQLVFGGASVKFDVKEHGTSREYAHKGEASETIRIRADAADPVSQPFVHFVYAVPARAPVIPELKASVWLRSQRGGVQLLGRVVLPHVRNPKLPEAAYTTMVEGTRYNNANNWQKLELSDVAAALKQKVQSLRLEFGGDIDTADAYVDQLVLNLYAGAGETQVWVNEIEIGPVLGERAPVVSNVPKPSVSRRHAAAVEINRDQLTVDGKRFFFRGIRLTDTPPNVHKLAGFNTVFLEPNAPQALLDEVSRLEMFAVPTLSLPELDGGVLPASRREGEELPRDSMTRFQQSDRLLFWYLGGGRQAADVDKVSRAASFVRETDPDRPIGVGAWNGLWPYSRNVDLLGINRWPLHTSLELTKYRDWLNQRRLLARPGTFTWTWVQTHLPEWHTSLVYDRLPSAGFDEPIGPQPEHIRLLTYIALSAGCRGLGFWSDRFLAQTHQGTDRLLEVALLNLELQLLEPVLLSILRPPVWIDTSVPQVKAAVLYGDKGILVLPVWLGPGSQYVPGQAAAAAVKLTVPLVPPNYQPWQVTPAEVQSLIPRRVAGGQEITITDFSLTAAIVFAGDMGSDGPVVYWQEQVRRMAKPAADWSIDLARFELEKARSITAQLSDLAPPITGAPLLLREASERLLVAQTFHKAGRYREAYFEANRAVRPVRQLMRMQWEQAVASVGVPCSSPYTISYFTLPRHWQFHAALKRANAGENLVRGGNFEAGSERDWNVAKVALDEVIPAARFSDHKPHEGERCLELSVAPKDPKSPPAALERSCVAATSAPVTLPPGTMVRVTAWVRVPQPITASPDGAMLYDSIGGEALAVRMTDAMDWKHFTLYRRMPSSGQVTVTFALTGIGAVQIDDVKVEPLFDPPTPGLQQHGNVAGPANPPPNTPKS
jgi:hypothetical protein